MPRSQRHILYYTALPLMIGFLCCPISLLAQTSRYLNPEGTTVETRFRLPEGYERISAAKTSYAYFLRSLRMRPVGAVVNNKLPERHYAGILNIPQMDEMLQDIQLCIRLRGEYLFAQGEYNKIAFTISTLQRIWYVPWVKGIAIVIGSELHWTQQRYPADRYRTFRSFLQFLFKNADVNTCMIDVRQVPVNTVMPGDMFIHTTQPGYAVIVLDVAFNPTTGDRIFLLARTYKSAHIACVLVNPMDRNKSPWYSINAEEFKIGPPEFIFSKQDLRRFQEAPATNPKR